MILTKNIDRWPDLTSENTWKTYHIGLARVGHVRRDRGHEEVEHNIEEQFSDAPLGSVRYVPMNHHWFGMDLLERPRLNAGQWIVFFQPSQPETYVVTQVLEGPPAQSPLVRSLRSIARLRARGGRAAFLQAAASDDTLVSLYALKRLFDQRLPSAPERAKLAESLRAIRNDPKKAPAVRVLASKVVNKAEGKPLDSDDEFRWVRSALMQAKESDWIQLRPYTEMLLEMNRRVATAKLFAELVTDPKQPPPVRTAVYATFHDPRLFAFEKPDPPSRRLFEACETMLGDSNPFIRTAGASLLHELSARIAAPERADYVARAKRAMLSRNRAERDRTTKFHLRNMVEALDRIGRQ